MLNQLPDFEKLYNTFRQAFCCGFDVCACVVFIFQFFLMGYSSVIISSIIAKSWSSNYFVGVTYTADQKQEKKWIATWKL